MTTTIRVTHDGPDHHKVRVRRINRSADGTDLPSTGNTTANDPHDIVLAAGESTTLYVYDTQSYRVNETP